MGVTRHKTPFPTTGRGGFQSRRVNRGVLSPGRLKSRCDPRDVTLSAWADGVGASRTANKKESGGIARVFLFYFIFLLFSLQKRRREVPEACAGVHGYENAHLQFLPQDRRPRESPEEIQR